jgi:hypothetical protein
MSAEAIDYLSVLTTAVAAAFAVVLFRHWQRRSQARYLLWWTIGVTCFGLASLAEAITALSGWHAPVLRLWYICGALLGGAPLAQGTVYLLLPKRTADRLAIGLVTYVAIASVFVLATPLGAPEDPYHLTGLVMSWSWVRLLTPIVNVYAVVFLIGGAVWSALRHRREGGAPDRVLGNWLIAIGAILPAVGGPFARAGIVEVLYITELAGLLTIWAGYRVISRQSLVPALRHREKVAL